MIYLENNLDPQEVFIPKNEAGGSYVSPCDKCYQEGYRDGQADCPECSFESKTVTVTADTQTVLPDSGYDGFGEVDIDATQFGKDNYDSGYTEGYQEGYEEGQDDCPECDLEDKTVVVTADTQSVFPDSGYEGFSVVEVDATQYGSDKYNSGHTDGYQAGEAAGIAEQKAKLVSTAITVNGTYSRPDGFGEVTVDVSGAAPRLEDKIYYLTSDYIGQDTLLPSEGYQGFSAVHIYDNGYGTLNYNQGYNAGEEAQKNKLSSTAITQNGTYTKNDGWSAITVSISNPPVESGKTLDLNSGDTSPWTVVPSSGYLSMGEVVVTDNGYGQEKYQQGYDDGRAATEAEDEPYLVWNTEEFGCYKTSDGQIYTPQTDAFRRDDGEGYYGVNFSNFYADYGYWAFESGQSPTRLGMYGLSPTGATEYTRLTFLRVPSSINWIGDFALQNCTGLKSLVLPSGLTDFSFSALDGCSSLCLIISNAYNAPLISGAAGGSTFNIAQSGALIVPTGSDYSAWQALLPSGWVVLTIL